MLIVGPSRCNRVVNTLVLDRQLREALCSQRISVCTNLLEVVGHVCLQGFELARLRYTLDETRCVGISFVEESLGAARESLADSAALEVHACLPSEVDDIGICFAQETSQSVICVGLVVDIQARQSIRNHVHAATDCLII